MGTVFLLIAPHALRVAATSVNGGEDNTLPLPLKKDDDLSSMDVLLIRSAATVLEAHPQKMTDKLTAALAVTDPKANMTMRKIEISLLDMDLTLDLPGLWRQCKFVLMSCSMGTKLRTSMTWAS